MNLYINLILLLLIILLYFFLSQQKPEPTSEHFINNNSQIENNLLHDYETTNRCDLSNPIVNNHDSYFLFQNRCFRGYINLDREILKTPLYFFPTLYYHPLE